MKEITESFRYDIGGRKYMKIIASSISSPYLLAELSGNYTTKELRELAQILIDISNKIDADSDFKNK